MPGLLDFIYDSETFVDLYQVLDIDMDAKSEEIKLAYIKLAKKNHPDQGGSSDKFQEITRAYEILYNKETRKEYDLYYIKKSYDEFKGDDISRLKDEYKNFISSSAKPITKEELDKLYADTFDDVREKNKEIKITNEELSNRVNDISIERQNMVIETSDDTLSNFIKEHGQNVNINDVFEYLKYKNSNSFSNSIIQKEWGTLDSLPGYANGYSSFMDENEYFGSNLYSNVSDINESVSKENMTNLNFDEFVTWKNTKMPDTKLSDSDVSAQLKRRHEEQEELFRQVETSLATSTKRKEVEKFLKTKNLGEDIDKYYEELENDDDKINKIPLSKSNLPEIIDLDDPTNLSNNIASSEYTTSSDIDGILKFMEHVKSEKTEDLGELEKEIQNEINSKHSNKTNADSDFQELKSNRELPKINNVRRREFK